MALTKKDLDEPLIPEMCEDCEYLCVSCAAGLTRNSGRPVPTCKLNHARHESDELRGTYIKCLTVICLNLICNSTIYKCKYANKERLA